jgi:hypothetical protein
MHKTLGYLPLLLAVAAAPAPDPLLQKLVAGARAVPAASQPFERVVRTTSQEKDDAPVTWTRTDRWDGKALTPLAINGKPPTPEQVAEITKASAGRPVPGYHRVADFLKGGAVRVADPQGRTVYRIDGLPKGSVNVGKDISGNLVGEATVDASGPQPYVSRLRVFLPKPLSFFMVAKLDNFEQVNEYRLGSDGRPVQVRSVQSMSGAQFGKVGSTRSEATYTAGR